MGLLGGALRKAGEGRRATPQLQTRIHRRAAHGGAAHPQSAFVGVSLSDETLRRLDEIWPGPGGEAPGAYAW
jgi:hypothetical protein